MSRDPVGAGAARGRQVKAGEEGREHTGQVATGTASRKEAAWGVASYGARDIGMMGGKVEGDAGGRYKSWRAGGRGYRQIQEQV